MEDNVDNNDVTRWPPMGLENVQVQFTDAFGNHIQQTTLTEAQLQELSQAGFSLTVFQNGGSGMGQLAPVLNANQDQVTHQTSSLAVSGYGNDIQMESSQGNHSIQIPTTSLSNIQNQADLIISQLQSHNIIHEKPSSNVGQDIMQSDPAHVRRIASEAASEIARHDNVASGNDRLASEVASEIARHDNVASGNDRLASEMASEIARHGNVTSGSDKLASEIARHGNVASGNDQLASEIARHGHVASGSDRLASEVASEMARHGHVASEEPDLASSQQQRNIQDSLQQLEALQSKISAVTEQVGLHAQQEQPDITVSSTGPGVVASLSALSGTHAQSSVIMHVDGVRQEIPITFTLDGKQYELYNSLSEYQPTKLVTKTEPEVTKSAGGDHMTSLSPVRMFVDTHLGHNSNQTIDAIQRWDQNSMSSDVSMATKHLDILASEKIAAGVEELNHERALKDDYPEPSRKSKRIARRDAVLVPEVPAHFNPDVKPYNVNELWCEACKRAFSLGCSVHKVQSMYDKVVLSRAWASLPTNLAIFKLKDEPESELGVFAKKLIPKYTQFGPFVAETIHDKTLLSNQKFVLSIESATGTNYLRPADEDKCNWMMFVRAANNHAEQNMVAYQFGPDIFFTTTRDIPPRGEMKVWYAAHYAHRIGTTLHPVLQDNTDGDDKGKFECYECEKSFKTAALLQKHLDSHDAEGGGVSNTAKATSSNTSGDMDKTYAPKQDSGVKSEDGFQSWKKKKRNMYLNKIKKYKEISKRADQKREQRDNESTVNDDANMTSSGFACAQCGLTFDNASVFNLHSLTHAADFGTGNADDDADNGDPVSPGAVISEWLTENGLKREDTPGQLSSDSGVKLEDTSKRDNQLECPSCKKTFSSTQELVAHTVTHARPASKLAPPPATSQSTDNIIYKRRLDPAKPYQCKLCSQAFSTAHALAAHSTQQHTQPDKTKPLTCDICHKKLMNNSALACHMKTHSSEKYFTCPMCRHGFDQNHDLKVHCQKHMVNGLYPCAQCHKAFPDIQGIKKHVRLSHTVAPMPCPKCDKVFPRADKLRLHMLRHTDHKDFMCDQCGRQFKRKDKLKEHVKRMHNPAFPKIVRPYMPRNSSQPCKEKFVPRVQPNEFHRFIYKCHQCLLGFKRRGMLVNHLAKRHPNIKPDMVPELNLPILRTQRDYFCQYCDKVYKSSSKRKNHILKNHPGAELPQRTAQSSGFPFLTDAASFSQCVGSVTTNPVKCEHCHRQYASRAKMIQHQRKDHPQLVVNKRFRRYNVGERKPLLESAQRTPQQALLGERLIELSEGPVVTVQPAGNEDQPTIQQHADLLTQAMSELTHNLADYRGGGGGGASQPTEFQITLPTVSNLQPGSGLESVDRSGDASSIVVTPAEGHATLDLTVLGQALMQGGFTATIVTDNTVSQGDHHQGDGVVTDGEAITVHADQELAIDQTVVAGEHHLVTDRSVVPQHETHLTDQSIIQTDHHLVSDQAVVVSDQHPGIDITDIATTEVNLATLQQTQTITVPLSLASQLISKTWSQASQNQILK